MVQRKYSRRADSIRRSWDDPRIRAARMARHAVIVDGTLYNSVPQAFRDLGLPLKKVIPFRGRLVKSEGGRLEYKHHLFELAP